MTTQALSLRHEEQKLMAHSDDPPQSLKNLWRLRMSIKAKLVSRHRVHSDDFQTLQSNLRQINKLIHKSNRERCKRNRAFKADRLNRLAFSDPSSFWKLLKADVTDPISGSDRCKLLEQITDSQNRIVASDPDQIENYLVDWWTNIFRMSQTLNADCKQQLRNDVGVIEQVCTELRNQFTELSESSAASQLANDAFVAIPDEHLQAEIRQMHTTTSTLPSQKEFDSDYAALQADISSDEIHFVMSNLRASGAGVDGVPPEALQNGCGLGAAFEEIVELFNVVFRTGVMPRQWNDQSSEPGALNPLDDQHKDQEDRHNAVISDSAHAENPSTMMDQSSTPSWETNRLIMRYKGKGSDPFCVANYRPLGVGTMLNKLFSLVLLRRLERFVEAKQILHHSQCGFRPGRGPQEAIFTLSEAVRAAVRKSDKMTFLLFIDLENAYGSINHAQLWATLVRKGVTGRFLASLMALYTGAVVTLDVNGKLMGRIPVQRGVLQGNPLSPLLFNIFLDDVIRDIDNVFAEGENQAGFGQLGVPLPAPCPDNTPSASDATHDFEQASSGGAQSPAQQSHQLPQRPRPSSSMVACPRCNFLVSHSFLQQHMADKRLCRIRKPSVSAQTSSSSSTSTASRVDHMSSQWFADDGVGLSCDHDQMQRLIDWLVQRLETAGLVLNASKTKIMCVPPLDWSAKKYQEAKKRICGKGFHTDNGAIAIVDSFVYLGVKLWWRWDWTEAWKFAQRRAWQAFYQLRADGFAQVDASLAAQLRAANAIVTSHLDYVAALAGSLDSSSIETNEKIVTAVLRLIAGNAMLDSQMLRIESGTWDQVTRIQMLQLRFACKLSLSKSNDFMHYRAFRMSLAEFQYDAYARASPSTRYRSSPCKRSWAQSLLLAADAFEQPNDTNFMDRLTPIVGGSSFTSSDHPLFSAIVNGGCQPAAALVRLECRNSVTHKWSEIARIDQNQNWQNTKFRLSSKDGQAATNYANGAQETAWEVSQPSPYAAVSTWSIPLKNSLFASLRKRGNIARGKIVADQLAYWKANARAGRTFVMWKASSYLEPYWFIDDIVAARRLLRARFDQWGDEYSFRRAVHGNLPRLQREQRACYLCDSGTWMPESLEHLLLKCQHPELVSLRARMRSDLEKIFETCTQLLEMEATDLAYAKAEAAQRSGLDSDSLIMDPDTAAIVAIEAVRGSTPDLERDDTLLTVLMCCTAGGSTLHRSHPANDCASIEERRRRPEIALCDGQIRQTAAWLRPLASDWQRAVATGSTYSARAILSRRFLISVASHSQRLFSLRRKLLQENDEFKCRSRDPKKPQDPQPAPEKAHRSSRRPRRNSAS